jgi:hypothetical protein
MRDLLSDASIRALDQINVIASYAPIVSVNDKAPSDITDMPAINIALFLSTSKRDSSIRTECDFGYDATTI